MTKNIGQIKKGDGLLVVDVQKDFCLGGLLADALKEGFEVFLLKAATRPVNHADGREAEKLMERLGARIVL